LDTNPVTPKKLRFEGYRVWPPIKSSQQTPLTQARLYLLHRIAVLAPDVLEALAALDDPTQPIAEIEDHPEHRAQLAAWATGYQLPPWVLSYARETLRLWRVWPKGRGREWSPNPADVSGELIPETGRRAHQPTVLRIPALHFDYLVRARIRREPFSWIAQTTKRPGVKTHVRHYAVTTAIRHLSAKLNTQ
jgi:hypothetical protein